ncbi:protein kinase family protein [Clostridium sp. DL1XJH146]
MKKTLSSYMSENGIVLSNNKNKIKYKKIDNDMIVNQLYIIDEFHRKLKGYSPSIKEKLPDNRGVLFREFKNKFNLFSYYSAKLTKERPSNDFEDLIYNCREEILNLGQRPFTRNNYKTFMNSLKRSYKNKEICIVDTWFENIWKNEQICINNINECSYNLYENDVLYLLIKLKSKGLVFDWDSLIQNYCKIKRIDEDGERLITDLFKFPYYSIKSTLKYFRNEYDNSYEKIERKFIVRTQNELISF